MVEVWDNNPQGPTAPVPDLHAEGGPWPDARRGAVLLLGVAGHRRREGHVGADGGSVRRERGGRPLTGEVTGEVLSRDARRAGTPAVGQVCFSGR